MNLAHLPNQHHSTVTFSTATTTKLKLYTPNSRIANILQLEQVKYSLRLFQTNDTFLRKLAATFRQPANVPLDLIIICTFGVETSGKLAVSFYLISESLIGAACGHALHCLVEEHQKILQHHGQHCSKVISRFTTKITSQIKWNLLFLAHTYRKQSAQHKEETWFIK